MQWRFFVAVDGEPFAQRVDGLVEVKKQGDNLLVVHGCLLVL